MYSKNHTHFISFIVSLIAWINSSIHAYTYDFKNYITQEIVVEFKLSGINEDPRQVTVPAMQGDNPGTTSKSFSGLIQDILCLDTKESTDISYSINGGKSFLPKRRLYLIGNDDLQYLIKNAHIPGNINNFYDDAYVKGTIENPGGNILCFNRTIYIFTTSGSGGAIFVTPK